MEDNKLKEIIKARESWEKECYQPSLKQSPERLSRFSTVSDLEIDKLYSPEDIGRLDFMRDIGFPSQYPYTRGVQASMYRGRLWTMRMFSGFGSAEDTNRRYKYLLSQGQTGLSVLSTIPHSWVMIPTAPGQKGRWDSAVWPSTP